MKRTALLLIFIFIARAGFAQITITQEDLPKVGDFWVKYFVDGYSSKMIPTPADTPQVWDFSNILYSDSITGKTFNTCPNVPFLNSYTSLPNDSLAAADNNESYFYEYDSTGLYLNEDYVYNTPSLDSIGAIRYWDSRLLILPTPFTYGSIRYDTSYGWMRKDFNFGHEWNEDDYFVNQSFECDAFGIMSTPAFTNIPVIRIKVLSNTLFEYVSNGSYFAILHSDSYSTGSYLYLKKGTNCLVFQIDFEPATGQIIQTSYYDNHFPTGTQQLNEPEKNTNVYPNPASSAANFSIAGKRADQLKVYNMLGECVLTKNVAGISTLTISTQNFNSGIYYYQLLNTDGSITNGKKFVVEK